MGVARALGVVGVRALAVGHRQHVTCWDVEELGVGIDEVLDQPGAGDPVGLGVLACDPLHGCSLVSAFRLR